MSFAGDLLAKIVDRTRYDWEVTYTPAPDVDETIKRMARQIIVNGIEEAGDRACEIRFAGLTWRLLDDRGLTLFSAESLPGLYDQVATARIKRNETQNTQKATDREGSS